MKVTFLTTWNIKCGIADYSRNLLHELRNLVDVEVVAIEPYEGPGIDLFQPFSRKLYDEIADSLNQGDLVHIQHAYSIFGGELSLYRNFGYLVNQINKPLVMTLHEVYHPLPFIWRLPRGIKIDLKTLFKNIIYGYTAYRERISLNSYRKAKKLIVHTSAQANVLVRVGLNRDKIVVLPVGIPDILVIPEHRDKAKEKMGLKGKTVLAILGFINWRKGYELAIHVLKMLPQNVCLVIAGGARVKDDEKYIQDLRKIIEQNKLSDRVMITGYLAENEIAKYLNATDIVLAPFLSAAGSASLSLIIAYGKPVIASDLPANREINSRIPCLDLFRSGNAVDLYGKIRHLLENEEKRNILASNALLYARQFSFKSIAERTKKIYEEII